MPSWIIEHTDKRVYWIDIQPGKKHFATIFEIVPKKSDNVIANFLQEYSGQEQYTYDQAILDDEDLARIVLELGQEFSGRKQWQRLWDWAWHVEEHKVVVGDHT